MNLTNLFHVIARHRALLVVGILIAALAGFAAAFRIETGTLDPRIQPQYRAATQILVSDPVSIFSSRNAAQVVPDGTTPATQRDLAALAVVYAYLASSPDLVARVETKVGALAADEEITAAQRTTQPTSSTNNGTYRLPIVEVQGTAVTPQRAEELSRAAAAEFVLFATEQQDAVGVPAEARVQLPIVSQRAAEPVDGTSPVLPVVAVGVGVLLAFLALIFAVDNARATRHGRAGDESEVPPPLPARGVARPTGVQPAYFEGLPAASREGRGRL
jgi:capsular polysaccharide biosynthesis protein